MNRRIIFLLAMGLFPFLMVAQQIDKREKYDISKDKVLYTIGYAHLDTEWNWEYPTTINEYIKKTMEDNFTLLEKYPDYVFNFTGSRRYNMMKEYYPESYKRVIDYIKQGRWFISGSSVDEGEENPTVLVSSRPCLQFGAMPDCWQLLILKITTGTSEKNKLHVLCEKHHDFCRKNYRF